MCNTSQEVRVARAEDDRSAMTPQSSEPWSAAEGKRPWAT